MNGYDLLGNAVVEQAAEDYQMLAWYIAYNPLTDEVNRKADREKKKREKELEEYIEKCCAARKEVAEKRWEATYVLNTGKKKKPSPYEALAAKARIDADLFAYKLRLREKHPRCYDIPGPWEVYRNCIIGARTTKEAIKEELRGPWLGMLMGRIDPEYLIKELDKKCWYMASHGDWGDIKPTQYDRKALGIDVRKPKGGKSI